jgi:HNH endonuclease
MDQRVSPPQRAAIWAWWSFQPENRFALDFRDEFRCFACHEAGTPLERAHIVADCSGGAFDPSNFTLLCAECHREAPMTEDPEIMFRWIANHERWGDRLVRECLQAIRKYNIKPEDITMDNLKGWHELMEANDMRFHPRSSRQEKINLVTMMLSEYLRRVKWTAPPPVHQFDEWV